VSANRIEKCRRKESEEDLKRDEGVCLSHTEAFSTKIRGARKVQYHG